jgi:hypothetical protein
MVAVLLTIEPGAIAADPADFDPEQGAVVDDAYLNPYFGIRYPLPAGWKPGLQPARPSYGGYYVLSTPVPPKDTKATILIAAQDNFFADRPIGEAKATLADLAHSIQEGATAEAEISSTTIAGHTFARLNIEASPLSRVVFATDIRCHTVIFTFTSANRDRLAQLAAGLGRLSLSSPSTAPVCVKDVRRKPSDGGPNRSWWGRNSSRCRYASSSAATARCSISTSSAPIRRSVRASRMLWPSGNSSPTARTDALPRSRPG